MSIKYFFFCPDIVLLMRIHMLNEISVLTASTSLYFRQNKPFCYVDCLILIRL